MERAERILNPLQSEQYRRALTQVRLALETVSPVPVRQIAFERSALGKPSLPGGSLHFSYSHTTDYAALAVCRSSAVGLDLEHDRILPVDPDLEEAFRVLEPIIREIDPVAGGHGANSTLYWTMLEAVSKCFGKSLREILAGGDRPWLRNWAATRERRGLFLLRPAPGLVCGVCLARTVAELQLRTQSSAVLFQSV